MSSNTLTEERNDSLVSVRDLKKYYSVAGGLLGRDSDNVKAVNGVSFEISTGESVGLAGESGCGKTTLAKMLVGLIEPTEGQIVLDGRDITQVPNGELRDIRSRVGVVYQDPFSSLNPRMSVRKIITEPLRTHRDLSQGEQTEKVEHLLEAVGLKAEHMYRYPHEFSGGQRQRIAIARALVLEPSFVILDEPTSALDVSVQAQILNLLDDLQEEFDLTYLFITHDINVLQYITDRVLIMYLGQIVESGPITDVMETPHHPYTETLLSSIPEVGGNRESVAVEGEIPSPKNPPSGCKFHTRCPYARDECSIEEPKLNIVDDSAADHVSRCLFRDPRSSPPERFSDG